MSALSLTEYVNGSGYSGRPAVAVDPDTVTKTKDLPASTPSKADVAAPPAGTETSADMSGYASTAGKLGDFAAGLTGNRTYGVGAALGGMVDGKPATDAAVDIGSSLAQSAMKDAIGTSPIGLGVSTAIGLAKEAFKDNPNFGASALSTGIPSVAGFIGSALGPLGSMALSTAAGYATRSSLADGLLGDMTDARSYEGMRERAENKGYGYGDTADMAARERSSIGSVANDRGVSISPTIGDVDRQSAFGADNARESFSADTEQSGLAHAAENALGNPKSLSDYAKSYDANFGSGLKGPAAVDAVNDKGDNYGGSGTDGSGTGKGKKDGSDGGSQDGSGV